MKKSTHPQVFYFIILMISSFFLSCEKQNISPNTSNDTTRTNTKDSIETTPLKKELDSYISENVTETGPGIAVLVMHQGKLIYKGARGMANISSGIAINHQTGFRLASVSKTFTAIAVMRLYDQGTITLADKLTDYFPEFSEAWDHITIHDLLSHRSGIPDYISDVQSSIYSQEANSEEVMNYLKGGPALEFAPGTSQQYSNSGYFLLSQIVAKVTNMKFSDYMYKHIFDPLGMKDSYILDDIKKLSVNDALSNGSDQLLFGKLWLAPGASSQVSSLDDFQAFFTALRDYQLVKKPTFNKMVQSHSTNIFGRNYGYGFMINANDPATVGHGGLLGGFVPEMRMNMDKDWQVVVLNNGVGGSIPYTIGDKVEQYFK